MKKDTYSANKDLKAVGDAIARQYAAGQYETLPDLITTGRTYTDAKMHTHYIEAEQIRFTVGTLRVTCEDCPDAVARIIARYRKGATGASWWPKSITQLGSLERGAWAPGSGLCPEDYAVNE